MSHDEWLTVLAEGDYKFPDGSRVWPSQVPDAWLANWKDGSALTDENDRPHYFKSRQEAIDALCDGGEAIYPLSPEVVAPPRKRVQAASCRPVVNSGGKLANIYDADDNWIGTLPVQLAAELMAARRALTVCRSVGRGPAYGPMTVTMCHWAKKAMEDYSRAAQSLGLSAELEVDICQK